MISSSTIEFPIGDVARIEHRDNYDFLEEKSVDFVLTDPPFNVSRKTNFHTYEKNTIHSYKFDKEDDWDTYSHEEFLLVMDNWAESMSRVLRKGGTFAIFCADAYLSHFMDSLKKAGLTPRRVFTWRKPNAVPINRAYMATSAVEYIITGVKGSKATFNPNVPVGFVDVDTKLVESFLVADKVSSIVESVVKTKLLQSSYPNSEDRREAVVEDAMEAVKGAEANIRKRVSAMWKEDKEGNLYLQGCVPNHVALPLKGGKRLHPTEKPVLLLEYLLALFSNKNDVVLDPFAGSASTGEACIRQGRKVILVEKYEEYYLKGKARIEALVESENNKA